MRLCAWATGLCAQPTGMEPWAWPQELCAQTMVLRASTAELHPLFMKLHACANQLTSISIRIFPLRLRQHHHQSYCPLQFLGLQVLFRVPAIPTLHIPQTFSISVHIMQVNVNMVMMLAIFCPMIQILGSGHELSMKLCARLMTWRARW